MNPIFCPDSVPNFFNFLDLSIAPPLLFYTYIPVIIISLFLGLFILHKDKHSLVSRLFAIMAIIFSLWVVNMIILWTGARNSTVMFFWQITPVIEVPLFIFSIYFALVMSSREKNDIDPKLKIFFMGLMFIVFAFLPTYFNISNYNIEICEGTPGKFFYSMYIAEVASILILVWVFIKKYRSIPVNDIFKKEILYIGISIISFLTLFTGTNLIAQMISIQEISLWDSLGMVFFLGILVYLIVRFKTFNIKLFATEALVWGLVFLIGSQFFFIKVATNFVLNGITFICIIILGRFLIKSVKKEIDQRERLEQLRLKLEESNTKLQTANEKLKGLDKLKTEFVSLASHQLRSPLTAIKGYASMLADGDYGEISQESREAIDRIYQSSKNLSIVVEDLLNVTKIEAGGMKYEMAPFNLCQMAKDEVKDFSLVAEKKGLKLNFEGESEDLCMVNGDKEKIRQVLINFIDNSVKYTKEGNINVSVKNINDKVIFEVRDTGMGMTDEIKGSLFEKFARGEGARMNTTGSGLGLYLAKEIAVAHKGRVWVESEGVGKGSSFFMEMDQIKYNC